MGEISLKNGYAFVEFEDIRDAEDAVYDLHGVDFMGERVTVELARGTPHGREKERWGHPPRGGSRSRSRSRSRDYRYDRRRGVIGPCGWRSMDLLPGPTIASLWRILAAKSAGKT